MGMQSASAKPGRSGAKIAVWIFWFAVFIFDAAFLFSPWCAEHMDQWVTNSGVVGTRIHACELVRDGRHREQAIRCAFAYSYQNKVYAKTDTVWSSDSPFLTPTKLDRELTLQSAMSSRQVVFARYDPADSRISDERWLAMPGLWVWMAQLLVGLFALAIYLEPATTVYKRANLDYDPASGELVEINHSRRNRQVALWGSVLVVLVLSCLYGLSNRIGNRAAQLGFSGLQNVSAQLVDCRHQYHGVSKGHDQIECDFRYSWNGQALKGEADALDFRLFPTDARMDTQVAQLNQGTHTVVAHVDPRHPGYAWAFISNDWFVPTTWGIFELMLWMVLLMAIAVPSLALLRQARLERPLGRY